MFYVQNPFKNFHMKNNNNPTSDNVMEMSSNCNINCKIN